METPEYSQDQSHPLYSSDRDHVDRLLAQEIPKDSDLIDLARLSMRYEEFPGAQDLKDDIIKTRELWGLTAEALHEKTRKIWSNGFRPGSTSTGNVGSGFDTAEENTIN